MMTYKLPIPTYSLAINNKNLKIYYANQFQV